MKQRALALAALALLTQCGDPQQQALSRLEQHHYSLSISEYHRAAREGHLQALQLMLAAGIAIDVTDVEGRTALHEAAAHSQRGAVELLLAQGAKVRTGPQGTLSYAVQGADSEILRSLLAAEPNLAADAQTLLPTLAGSGQRHAVAALLSVPGVEADLPALLAAARKGDTGVLDLLLQSGSSPWAIDATTGRTALMEAAASGQEAAVQMLLGAGSNRFCLDVEGHCALDLAKKEPLRSLLTAPPSQKEQRDMVAMPRATPGSGASLAELQHVTSQEARLPLHGAMLTTFPSVEAAMQLQAVYQSSVGHMAERMTDTHLYLNNGSRLTLGQLLPGTAWRLSDLRTRPTGPSWWLQEAVLTHTETQQRMLMIPGLPLQAEKPCAEVLVSQPRQIYEVQEGDSFTANGESYSVHRILADRLLLRSPKAKPVAIRWPGRSGG
jgi:hypothetical protein